MVGLVKRFESETYALLRIVVGFLFLWHGMQKLFGFPVEPGYEIPAFVTYVGGPIELVGGALVMLGLFTRGAAFLCSGMMAAAYWMAHGTQHLLPLLNEGELAALYCFVFLAIAAHGPGIWSLDAARGASGANS
jgi:putative oxidoreductase